VTASVHPSVCQDACIVIKKIIVCQCLNTIQNRDISSLSTPTGVAGNCPLLPEIFAESYLPPSKNADLQISTVRDSKFNYDE